MIAIKQILVPTDLSDYSRNALTYATELASTYGATLHLLHVVDSHWVGPTGAAEFPGQIADFMQRFQEEGEREVQEMKEAIGGIHVETAVVLGIPHVEIVRYARQRKVDVIVLTTHGRTGLSHALIGSVAEKVVQMAPCPVLSIKHPEHEFVLP